MNIRDGSNFDGLVQSGEKSKDGTKFIDIHIPKKEVRLLTIDPLTLTKPPLVTMALKIKINIISF